MNLFIPKDNRDIWKKNYQNTKKNVDKKWYDRNIWEFKVSNKSKRNNNNKINRKTNKISTNNLIKLKNFTNKNSLSYPKM